MTLVQCKLGPTETPVGGRTYSFQTDRDGRAVADIDNPDHLACFLAVEHYVVVGPASERTEPVVDLRDDGPTIAEWLAGGYPASKYPPDGFAAKSTAEEIAAAIEAQNAAAAEAARLAQQQQNAGDGQQGNDPDIDQTDSGMDIIVIKGIGETLKPKLTEYGLRTVEDLLKLAPEQVAFLDKELKLNGRITREDWIGQAKALLAVAE